MTLFTSGTWSNTNQHQIALTQSVYEFMCDKFPQIKGSDVEVNRVDLSYDGVFGWCELAEELMYKEFFIQIHNDLNDKDYVITLIHELVHVKQTCDNFMNDERREEEASIWEKILSKEYWDNVTTVHKTNTRELNRV